MEGKNLYHYTSLNTFISIIKEGKFKLFDITKSNDPLEGMFAVNALEYAYHELYRTEEIIQQQHKALHKAFFLFKNEIESFGRLKDVYTSTCFCHPEKDTKVAMWRSYGNNGKGISIATTTDYLTQLASEKSGFRFGKIEYLTTSEMQEKAKEFWKDYLAFFANNDNSHQSELSYEEKKKLLTYYEDGYFYKHISNRYENEYRLLYRCIDLNDYIFQINSVDENIGFVAMDDDIKICYSIDIKKEYEKHKFMDHIIIGPNCRVSENELKMVLCKYKIPFYSIYKSTDDNVEIYMR